MKKLALLLVVLLSVLVSSAVARGAYVVRQGDCLSAIGQSQNLFWQEIAKLNKINPPYLIYPGEKLSLPKPEKILIIKASGKEKMRVKVSTKHFFWQNPGADKYQGTVDEALKLLEYPIQVRKMLKRKIRYNRFNDYTIKNGDHIQAMTFGKNKVEYNVIADWENPKRKITKISKDKSSDLAAKKYSVIFQKVKYSVIYPYWCGNWSRLKDQLIPKLPQKTSTAPKFFSVSRNAIAKKNELTYIPPGEECKTFEQEPTIGVWIYKNGLAKGRGIYIEYLTWLRNSTIFGLNGNQVCGGANYNLGWSPGVGIYGYYSPGESRISSYDWKEWGIGPQIGIKYSAIDKQNHFWQWQAKLRLIYEWSNGNNTEGYWKRQSGWKPGFYTEYTRIESENFLWGLTAEGWIDWNQKIDSSWSGDSPSGRGQLAVSAFGQWKLNNDWQFRGIGSLFYQDWDYYLGLRVTPEFRWKETMMFGPMLSLPIHLGSVYDGIARSNLITYGAFIRLELGTPIRAINRRRRMDSIRKTDAEWLNKLQKMPFHSETVQINKGGVS